MEELKPCPFCGCFLEERHLRKRYSRYLESDASYIHPDNGCIILKWRITTDAEIDAWNRRVE